MTLRELEIGESAVVEKVGGEGELRQHFLDMGVIPGARVTLVKYAPMGDPMELLRRQARAGRQKGSRFRNAQLRSCPTQQPANIRVLAKTAGIM